MFAEDGPGRSRELIKRMSIPPVWFWREFWAANAITNGWKEEYRPFSVVGCLSIFKNRNRGGFAQTTGVTANERSFMDTKEW